MNEQAKDALTNLLNLAIDGIEGAKNFAEREIPDVIEQLLMWEMVQSLVFFVIGTVFLIMSSILVAKTPGTIKRAAEARDNKESWIFVYKNREITTLSYDARASGAATLVPAVFFALGSTWLLNITWLKIWIAPKLFLLEYASDLIK